VSGLRAADLQRVRALNQQTAEHATVHHACDTATIVREFHAFRLNGRVADARRQSASMRAADLPIVSPGFGSGSTLSGNVPSSLMIREPARKDFARSPTRQVDVSLQLRRPPREFKHR